MSHDKPLELTLTPDRGALQLRITDETGNELHLSKWEAPEVDDLIRSLGDFRSQMSDPVTPELEEGSFIRDCLVDPKIRISNKDADDGRTLVAIRHDGFGWLGFRLRPQIVNALIEQLGGRLR